MDGPPPPASAGPRPGRSAAAAELPHTYRPSAVPGVVHLIRPDDRLQVGLGPRAWLVQGWTPASPTETDPASSLVLALAGGRSGRAARPGPGRPCRVIGHGDLAAALRAHLATATDPGSDDDVVVLVSAYAVPVGTARRPDLAGAPVLPVVAQPSRVVVGPWTGLAGGPCLHCLDLHRTDVDPAWPLLAAALDDPMASPPPPGPGDDVLGLVTALTGLLVAGLGRDGRDELGLAYEVGSSRPHLVLRRWPAHPACPWHPGRPGVC